MHRERMAKYKGKRLRLTAEVSRYGTGNNGEPTVCLKDVQLLDGEIIASHCWIPLVKGGIEGKVIFSAKIQSYKKPAKSIFGESTISYRLSGIEHYKQLESL